MQNLGDSGGRMIAFKTIYELSPVHMETIMDFKKMIITIPLKKDESISFVDTDEDHHIIKGKSEDSKVMILGNNLIFDQSKVTVRYSHTEQR